MKDELEGCCGEGIYKAWGLKDAGNCGIEGFVCFVFTIHLKASGKKMEPTIFFFG